MPTFYPKSVGFESVPEKVVTRFLGSGHVGGDAKIPPAHEDFLSCDRPIVQYGQYGQDCLEASLSKHTNRESLDNYE